ncbi:MAG TPA: ATP-binding protein [Trueperaceae bacterium]|nr:ATP-binding protein [Trueperaceae bacterium]
MRNGTHRQHRWQGQHGGHGQHGPHGLHGSYGPYGAGWRRHRRRASLRRRLTVAFAVVALGAVMLTTWLTIGTVASVQRDLFREQGRDAAPAIVAPDGPDSGGVPADPRGAGSDPATAEAFRRISRSAFRAGALSFVAAVIAAGAFTNFLTRPLHALTRGARRLEAGERGIRLAVPTGRDELGSLTEAFNALVTGLERQEAWRRDMTADIAHDLRTPLAVLRSEIEGMQDGVVPTDAAALDRLHREVMLLARLIDDLRTLSIGEGGAPSLQRTAVAMEPLVRRSLDAFGSRAADVGAELVQLPIDPELRADVDADRISQVIGNLLDNALRHAGGVRIEVGAEALPALAAERAHLTEEGESFSRADVGTVRVWVRDHGPGLHPDVLEQVFERFYRGDNARSRDEVGARESGSGLGLAIARAIVEAHGGSIGARNDPDGGAVFEFYLPAAA